MHFFDRKSFIMEAKNIYWVARNPSPEAIGLNEGGRV